jgi:hypothetical protein
MKAHLLSCSFICLVLLMMYKGDRVLSPGIRVFSEFAPGGFVVSYYAGADFEDLITQRSLRSVVLNYGEGRPARGVPVDNHSARWEGWLTISASAEYVFFLQSQGGARLWVGDVLVVDKWDDHKWTPGVHGQVGLEKGVHKVIIEHCKTTGPGAIRLRWAGGTIPANTVMGVPHVQKNEPR